MIADKSVLSRAFNEEERGHALQGILIFYRPTLPIIFYSDVNKKFEDEIPDCDVIEIELIY